jgi:hypothetical protein
MDTRVELL